MNSSRRLTLVFSFFILFGLLVAGRLFYWQIVKASEFSEVAKRQYSSSFEVEAERGEIFASDGFPFVANQREYLLYAVPKMLDQDLAGVARRLVQVLQVNEADSFLPKDATSSREWLKKKEIEIKTKIESDSNWVRVENKISQKTKEEIEKLAIKGIGFEEKEGRFYPEGTSSAHLLGFVGFESSGQQKGYFGVEGKYDLELKGKPGHLQREKDALGRPILVGDFWEEEKKNGRQLVLTLDRAVQRILEQNLEAGLKRYEASEGSVIVADPYNGSILGMHSLPAYNPALYSDFDEGLFPNPAIAQTFEPGSIFKIVMMASALNEGAVDPDTICDRCDGPRSISGYLIKTWNDRYYPQTSVTDILIHSDNVGMIFVAEKLGKEKLYSYLEKFGFGKATGIDLEEEVTPKLRPEKEWKEIDLATVSFGQGIAVSRIQIVRAAAAIANGGLLVTPHVVEKIISDGKEMAINLPKSERILKPETCQTLSKMMVGAVDNGEAKWAKLKGYQIAGKTGTAQIPVSGHYDKEKTIVSFVGFMPASKPKFVMLVTLREPKTSPWGSETAAPLWFEIAKQLSLYYGISPG